jgi:outer membrane protein assembly factor BamB
LFSSKPLVQKIEVSKEVANSYLQTYSEHSFEEEGPTEYFSQVLQGSHLPASSSALDQFPQWNGHLPVQPSPGIYEKGNWLFGPNGVFFFSKEKGTLELKSFEGELKWFFDSGTDVNFTSMPLILKNQSFVAGDDNTLTSFKSATGEVLWTNSTEHQISFLAFLKNSLLAFSQLREDQFIICTFNAKTGEYQNCSAEKEGKILSVTQTTSSILVTTAQGKVLSFEGSTDAPKWEFLANAAVKNPPSIIDQSLIVTSESGQVVSLDKNTGAKTWEYQTTEPLRASQSLVPGYNLVMLMSKSGDLIALKRRSGEGKWKFKSYNQGSFGGSTIVRLSNKLAQATGLNTFYGTWALWTPCGNDRFCVYNPDSGQLMQRIYTHGPIASPPLFLDGQVYVVVESATDVGSADKKVKEWAVVRLSPPPDPAAKAAAAAAAAGASAPPAKAAEEKK